MNSRKILLFINTALLLIVVGSVSFNQLVLAEIKQELNINSGLFKSMFTFSNIGDKVALSGNVLDDSIKFVVSQGIPPVYGAELGVSFDRVQQGINVMRQFDPAYGQRKINLAGSNMQRYIEVGLKISCEYCCSAKAIVFADGKAACGCAHSQAMRGLLAYLIINHGSSYSDDELLRELALWKGMYFPKQMIAKLSGQLQGQAFTPDTASLVLNVNLPNYGGGDQNAPLPSEIKDLPSMVGGC